MIGWQEILIVFLVLLLLFGGRKLPELARGMGKAVKEFRSASSGLKGSGKSRSKKRK